MLTTKQSQVRVSDEILTFIKDEIHKLNPKSKVMLFGSRVDMEKKGGDLDFLILSDERLSEKELRNIRYRFYDVFGDQKIDLVNFTFDEYSPFKELILLQAVCI